MKAHLMDTNLLIPRSRSCAKVKVKYQGHVSQKIGVSGALVFHKHILFHNVFKRLLFQGCKKSGLCGKGLTLYQMINSSKLKVFEADKTNSTEKFKLVLGRVENIVGKEENAGYQHFLLFPQCFQKASFSG